MTTRTVVPEAHVHFWRIDPPDGPTSKGVCRGCGEERVFQNFLPEDYESTSPLRARTPKGYEPPVEYTNPMWW